MKRILILSVILMSGIMAQNAQTLDEIIAIVGDEIILKSSIDQVLIQMKVQQRSSDAELLRQRPLIMKQLVEQKLILTKAKLDSITITENELDVEANNRWRDLISRVSQYGGESYLQKVYNEPIREIRKRHRKVVEEEMIKSRVMADFMQSVRISRDEVYQFYSTYKDSLPVQPERVELAFIAKKATPSADALTKARNKAVDVIERLKKGEKFADLAKSLSEGPSASRGGFLGKVSRGTFVTAYENAVDKLSKPGDYTEEPILSPFGYHVILLHSKSSSEIETSHILFQVRADQSDMQRTQIFLDSVRRAIIMDSLTFAEAAQRFSDDAKTRDSGGELGIVQIANIKDATTKSMVALQKEGEISAPIQVGTDTYQIVKLIKRYPASKYDIDRDFSLIQNIALRRKQYDERIKLIEKLRAEIPITLY